MKKILNSVGIFTASLLIFLAGYKTPDLLKKEQSSKENEPSVPTHSISAKGGDIETWTEIWLKSIPGSELKKTATEKLGELGFFKDWESRQSAKHQEALENSKTAKSSDEWLNIWLNALPESDLQRVSKARLEDLGFFKDLEARQLAKHQKAEVAALTAKTEKEWLEIWLDSLEGSKLRSAAFDKLNGFAFFEKMKIKEEIDHGKARLKALEIAKS